MAEIKISELEKATNLNSQCCFPVVSEGTTKKIEFGTLADLLNIGDVSDLNTTDKSNVVAAVNEVNNNVNELNNKSIYSTEENIIGYWVDGKPIYRRVFALGLLGTDSPTTYELTAEFKNILNATFYVSAGNTFVTIPAIVNDNITNAHATSNGAGKITITASRQSKDQFSDWTLNTILEYTKTTD